jgi:flagellar motor switch/type III secretory pathway protein FliN
LTVRAWLPREALFGDAAKAVLAETLAAWSKDWIGRAVVFAPVSARASDAEGASAKAHIEATEITLNRVGKRILSEALVDADFTTHVPSDADSKVMDHLVIEALDDLASRIDARLDVATATVGSEQIHFTIALSLTEIFDITVPSIPLMASVKAQLGRSSSAAKRILPRQAALRKTPLVTQAVLGSAELTLREVRELSAGDVLVLDRALNEAIELHINGSSIARGRLLRDGDQLSIQL